MTLEPLLGPASGDKGSKGRNKLDCIRRRGVKALVFRKESCQSVLTRGVYDLAEPVRSYRGTSLTRNHKKIPTP